MAGARFVWTSENPRARFHALHWCRAQDTIRVKYRQTGLNAPPDRLLCDKCRRALELFVEIHRAAARDPSILGGKDWHESA